MNDELNFSLGARHLRIYPPIKGVYKSPVKFNDAAMQVRDAEGDIIASVWDRDVFYKVVPTAEELALIIDIVNARWGIKE